jgi:hypothetical protein
VDEQRSWAPWVVLIVGVAAAAAALSYFVLWGAWGWVEERPPAVTVGPAPPVEPEVPTSKALVTPEVAKQVKTFCAACHPYPSPSILPKSAWQKEVSRGFEFFSQSKLNLKPPLIGLAVAYYEERAPDKLPEAVVTKADKPLCVRLERTGYPPLTPGQPATISNVNLVKLFDKDKKRLDILATEMRTGEIMVLKPYEAKPAWQVLGKAANPAHTEVVDLDKDGNLDILVADLGNFAPTDELRGKVIWLRGNGDGTFTPVTLLEGVGRVADVRAADFNGDGKLDLVVAVFGWQTSGQILLLENQTTDWSKPKFKTHVLDKRNGTIHVPVTDLNGDGKPDFVALISQEHETVVAFLNEGDFKFRQEVLYAAPHPAYGSSGIELVDLNKDGKLDVLYTNGDVLDGPSVLKPYHAVRWLENQTTDWNEPKFKHHVIGPLYGAHRAVAVDLDGDGDLDILAVSNLPSDLYRMRDAKDLAAVVVFEQVAPGKFVQHALETKTCDHVTCAAGDLFGTGRPDLVTAAFTIRPTAEAVTVWRNLGRPKSGD